MMSSRGTNLTYDELHLMLSHLEVVMIKNNDGPVYIPYEQADDFTKVIETKMIDAYIQKTQL